MKQLNENKKNIRTMEGVVVSDKMSKTRIVAVTREKKHPVYEKYFAITTRYKAHDEHNEYQQGDIVKIGACRPLSKDKKWEIIKLVKKGVQQEGVPETSEEKSAEETL